MDELLAARSQMALSLGFHMIFATAGMGMPLLLVVVEGLWLWTKDRAWLAIVDQWAKGTAILFAVGAVSGTVLSFELGLLWPKFMEFAGPIIGMPFSLEGFAFFFEAIFLGIVLYGRDRVGPWAHWFACWMVLLSGTASGMFVVCANAWMNSPTGFVLQADGTVTDIDPVAAMFNDAALGQSLHMAAAAFLATAWLVAGLHAFLLLKDKTDAFNRRALTVALAVGVVLTPLQPATGHLVADHVAHAQPVKFAALEGLWETKGPAPFTIGGLPDEETETTSLALEIPYLLSILTTGTMDGEIKGLKAFPKEDRPPVVVTHLAYQLMLAAMATIGACCAATVVGTLLTRGLPTATPYLWLLTFNAPMGIIGIEAGWTATEVGRQPWVIQGILRTKDAVTEVPGLWYTFLAYSSVYVVLGILTAMLLVRQFRSVPKLEVET